LELFHVERREAFETAPAHGSEAKPDRTPIRGIRASTDQARVLRSIDQFHNGVMAKQQVLGHFTDRRTPSIRVGTDDEQQLVLPGGQSSGLRLPGAPSQEAPKAISELQEAPVVLVAEATLASGHVATPPQRGRPPTPERPIVRRPPSR
jgi:hypothetical protein